MNLKCLYRLTVGVTKINLNDISGDGPVHGHTVRAPAQTVWGHAICPMKTYVTINMPYEHAVCYLVTYHMSMLQRHAGVTKTCHRADAAPATNVLLGCRQTHVDITEWPLQCTISELVQLWRTSQSK